MLRVPKELNLGPEHKLVPLPIVTELIEAETRALAASFDRRNGNQGLQKTLEKQADLWQYAIEYSIKEKGAATKKIRKL